MHNIPTKQPIHTITSLYSQSELNSDAGCKDRVVFNKEMVYEESITAGVCLPTLSFGISSYWYPILSSDVFAFVNYSSGCSSNFSSNSLKV